MAFHRTLTLLLVGRLNQRTLIHSAHAKHFLDSGVKCRFAFFGRNVDEPIFFPRLRAKRAEATFEGPELVGVLDVFEDFAVHRCGAVSISEHVWVFGNSCVKRVKGFRLFAWRFNIFGCLTKTVCDLKSLFCIKPVLNELRVCSRVDKLGRERVLLIVADGDVVV